MAIRPPPAKISAVLVTLQREAKRKGATAYSIAQQTGISVNTIRRLLMGEGSPTLATIELVAAALGVVVKAKARR